MLEPIPFAGMVEIDQPVALMTEYGIKPLYEGALQEGMFLYTYPAKTPTLVLDGNRVYPTTKTLTDEEILREAYYILMREQQRKAQEK